MLDRETLHYKDVVAVKYAELVYNGLWFTPLREALDAFVDSTQGPVTGTVRLKLYKGNIISAGRKALSACTAKILPPSGRRTSTTSRTPRASSTCTACRSRSRPNGLPISGWTCPSRITRFKRWTDV